MHFNSKKLVVSMAVSAALVASWYPANLNAITITTNTTAPNEAATAPQAPAQPITHPVVAPQTHAELTVQEPKAIDIWLEKLAYKESGNNPNLKILDVNGKYSYGCLQFQEDTFRTYARKYGFIAKGTATEDAIYDCDLQKKIAKRMLAEDSSNWRAWYNSSMASDVGLPPKQ